MAWMNNQGMGCVSILVMSLIFGLVSLALKGCDDRSLPEMQADRAWKDHVDEYGEDYGKYNPYSTPEAQRTRDAIRQYERTHGLEPYKTRN